MQHFDKRGKDMRSIDPRYIHDTLQELSQFKAKGQITDKDF